MKLLTHNMFKCNKRGCMANNFPLKIEAAEWVRLERPFNEQLIRRLFDRLDWGAFLYALKSLEWEHDLPEVISEEDFNGNQEGVLEKTHELLLNRSVITGLLTCPGCSRIYEIKNKIPNMLLEDDEI